MFKLKVYKRYSIDSEVQILEKKKKIFSAIADVDLLDADSIDQLQKKILSMSDLTF